MGNADDEEQLRRTRSYGEIVFSAFSVVMEHCYSSNSVFMQSTIYCYQGEELITSLL